MQTADIVIIGAGIAGISAAARLARDAKVMVLEAEAAPGYHATGRSAAVFVRNYGNEVLRALNVASQGYLEHGGYLSPRGELLLALPSQEFLIEGHLARGDTVERLDEGNMRDLVPILKPGRFAGAAYEREAHDIDVDRLMQDFMRQLRAGGGAIVVNAGVTALEFVQGVWTAQTKVGAYSAPVVINAAGAWGDQIAGLAGVPPTGLQPMRRSAAIIPMPDHDLSAWPLFAGIEEDWYAKPEAGQLMVSPADEDPVEPQDAYPEEMTLAHGIDRFEKSTTIQVRRVTHEWAGLRTFARDRTPVIGFDRQAEGFMWLAGQGGYGVQTSPVLSQLVADLCLKRPHGLAAETVHAMAPNRF